MSFSLRAVYGYEIFNTTKFDLWKSGMVARNQCLESALDEAALGLSDNPKLSSYYLERWQLYPFG